MVSGFGLFVTMARVPHLPIFLTFSIRAFSVFAFSMKGVG